MAAMFCAYCGKAREFWCRDCGENHLMTGADFYAENGELAEDDDATEEDYRPAESVPQNGVAATSSAPV